MPTIDDAIADLFVDETIEGEERSPPILSIKTRSTGG